MAERKRNNEESLNKEEVLNALTTLRGFLMEVAAGSGHDAEEAKRLLPLTFKIVGYVKNTRPL